MSTKHSVDLNKSRREFLKTTAAAAAAAGLTAAMAETRSRRWRRTLKIALVGCGNRGAGASSKHSAPKVTELWALADTFEDRIQIASSVYSAMSEKARDEGKPAAKSISRKSANSSASMPIEKRSTPAMSLSSPALPDIARSTSNTL